MKHYTTLLLSLCLGILVITLHTANATDQFSNLYKLLKSKRSKSPSLSAPWTTLPAQLKVRPVHVTPQNGLKEADKIGSLPGQPTDVDFDQYAGYVNVDPVAGKELFYYFAESPHNSSSKPLVFWFNGGPGCSSFGNGGLLELGPFRVKSDGKTLYRNPYAWNNVANVLFLESPAGVGFSFGRNETATLEQTGDMSTAKDAYTFVVNWLERFPEYKNRDLYLTGESYAGHYVPQLAYTILQHNSYANHSTTINLKGIAIGNAWIDDATNTAGMYDFFWTHAMFSDETHAKIQKFCNDFSATSSSSQGCVDATDNAGEEVGNIDIYNIYAPLCVKPGQEFHVLASADVYDPCASNYVETYLNTEEVQKALHVKHTKWESCSSFDWQDSPDSVLPVIRKLISSNISVWIYSGDVDGRVPVTSTKYSINTFKLPIKTSWRPWYKDTQVGGYVVGYEGLVFVTVRGAGHLVPSYQPERALTMVSSFLQGVLPPQS